MDNTKKKKSNVGMTMSQSSGFDNCIDAHADELFKKVKRNPLLSLLIAGGLGYLFAKITRGC
ncbi:hypothetical protein [Legionella drancourtii]|uniref:Uncharacterized protein n=1 Tax=Legionella drancourtii LLAP12 TaxID=658187 RepID=G9EK64_9GAMM|nr:hypothetical protein [Legionella drancourtii]EHL32215.1 hypothetical protein LDG_5587 [Legionella drancourtii LLAP12]